MFEMENDAKNYGVTLQITEKEHNFKYTCISGKKSSYHNQAQDLKLRNT